MVGRTLLKLIEQMNLYEWICILFLLRRRESDNNLALDLLEWSHTVFFCAFGLEQAINAK